jgi:uncharacterized DUF497 family protein
VKSVTHVIKAANRSQRHNLLCELIIARCDYGEPRLLVMARFDDRLHAAAVTPRGEDLHVISFRKANKREVTRYGKKGEK